LSTPKKKKAFRMVGMYRGVNESWKHVINRTR
jgi:hypothetical protein